MHSFLGAALFVVACGVVAASPTISNITASQRPDGSRLVDVYFDLADAVDPIYIGLVFSIDDGATYTLYPSPKTLTGDIGMGVANGTSRHIVWNVALDKPGIHATNAKAKILCHHRSASGLSIQLPGGPVIDFAWIPPGSSTMGTAETDPWFVAGYADPNETPPHTVTIASGFYIARTELTQAQWLSVANSWPSTPPPILGDLLPAANISWNDAQSYVSSLNQLGLGTFSLPSEAQWEYAARGGSTTIFPIGDSTCTADGSYCQACELTQYAWYCSNGESKSHPVAQLLPNQYGLYDMLGNVSEFCQDDYAGYDLTPTDGSAYHLDGILDVVRRGGFYASGPGGIRPASRITYAKNLSLGSVGFRLVVTLP